jgi:hypothetical protein
MNYIQQTDEQLRNEISTVTTAAETGSWDRKAACFLKIQTILSELARRAQDKQTRAMLSMTRWITAMTAVVTIATLLQLFLAWRPATPTVAQPVPRATTAPAQPARDQQPPKL